MVSSTLRPHFTPQERPGTHFTVGWVGPRAGMDRCGKSRPHRDSIPDRPARSSVAIPTELPGPLLLYKRSHNAICHDPTAIDATIPYVSRRIHAHKYAAIMYMSISLITSEGTDNGLLCGISCRIILFPFITVNILHRLVIIMYTENMTAKLAFVHIRL